MTETGYARAVTAKPIKALVIRPDDSYEIKTVQQDLEAFQSIVGGYIEAVTTEHCVLWCNEDGKNVGLPINQMATYLWWKLQPEMEARDTLSGCVLITGPADSEGNSTPVPESVIDLYRRMEAARLETEDQSPNGGPDLPGEPSP